MITAPAGSAYAIPELFKTNDRPLIGFDCFAEDLQVFRPAVSGEIGVEQATSVYYFDLAGSVNVSSPILDTASGSSNSC